MKKIIKISLITGILCCLAGIGMITAGAMMGGAVQLENSPLWGRMSGNYHKTVSEYQAGNFTDQASLRESFAAVEQLELEAGPTGLIEIVEESREDQNQDIVIVHNGDGVQYQCRLEGTKLKIELPQRRERMKPGMVMESITILVPERYQFRDVEVEVLAGNFHAQTIYADYLDLEVGAGKALVSGGKIGKLEINCGAGQVLCYAPVKNDASVDCEAGSAYVTLAGSYEQYDYELSCAVGAITLEGVAGGEYGGFSQEKSINHHTGRSVDLECEAGSITISYQEEL